MNYKMILIFTTLLSSNISYSRLEETAKQLACFKSADYLDSARNQSDRSVYGLFVKNNYGNKAVILNRQTNEYVVYTDDEIIACETKGKKSNKLNRFFAPLSIKVQGLSAGVGVGLVYDSEKEKLILNDVSFGGTKQYIENNEIEDKSCKSKVTEKYEKLLFNYLKSRLSKLTQYCLAKKRKEDWDIYKYTCKEFFNTCAKSAKLNSLVERSKTAVFQTEQSTHKSSSGAADQK